MAKKNSNSDEENKRLCEGCSICCEHICMEIDKPTTKDELHDILWYLMHQDVIVFFDDEDDWFIEFKTKCKALADDKKCTIYSERPNICREYSQEDCERYGEGEYYEEIFRCREEFLEYINKTPKLHWLFYGKKLRKK